MSAPSFVLLPGLGADRRMFGALADRGDVRVPEWIAPATGDTIVTYAERFAHTQQITRQTVLGGCSFGGYVAWEMVRVVRPKCVVLIGSASHPSFIRWYGRAAFPLARVLPHATVEGLRAFGAHFGAFFGARERAHRELFAAMLRESSNEFVRWALRAVAGWRPEPSLPVPVRRIHGARDRVIAPPRDHEARILADAGHLLTLTHAREVEAFLDAP